MRNGEIPLIATKEICLACVKLRQVVDGQVRKKGSLKELAV